MRLNILYKYPIQRVKKRLGTMPNRLHLTSNPGNVPNQPTNCTNAASLFPLSYYLFEQEALPAHSSVHSNDTPPSITSPYINVFSF